MKIRMSFGVVKTVIIVVVLACVLAVLGLDIAILAGAKGVYANSPAIPAVSMVAGVLIGVACLLLLFNSFYKFKEQGFVVMLGFFADKIAYGDVIMLKQNIETKELYAIVKNGSDAQVGIRINVPAAKTDDFVKNMREHIGDIAVEMFSQPKKKKKDK